MNFESYADLMWDYYVARSSAFCTQWYDPEIGKTGYKKATRLVNGEKQDRPLSRSDLVSHLRGDLTLGLYQLSEENKVKWMVFDIDGADVAPEVRQSHALQLARVLYRHQIPYIVSDSGSKGYHITVFFKSLIDAQKIKALGHYLETQVPAPRGISVEVFPKQGSISRYGNLVKPLFAVHRKTGRRAVPVDKQFRPLGLDAAAARFANQPRLPEADVDSIIARYQITVEPLRCLSGDQQTGGTLTPPCLARLMDEGAEWGRLDVATFRLYTYLRDRSLPREMADAAVEVWNREKNKPPYDDAGVRAKGDSAYTHNYSPFPCNEPLMDHYCSSSCRFFQSKVRGRWRGKPATSAVGEISRD